MKKLKIAVIGLKGLPAFGGAARSGENLINVLKNHYEFHVMSVGSHTTHNRQQNGYIQIVFKPFLVNGLNTVVYYFKSAFYCLFKGRYDLIHVHHITSALILPILKLKYRVILTLHGIPQKVDKWESIGWWLFPILERVSLIFSDIVITVSYSHLSYYKKLTSKPIYHIPNGVVNTPENNLLPPNNITSEYILFAAARILKIKGCHTFLKALINIKYSGNIVIIGDIEQNKLYREEILKLSKYLNVTFTGLIKDRDLLLRYIKNARLFIFPSIIEAMSNILLEVAVMRIPIIASNIPENKIIFNTNEILYFKVEDYLDLSKKITWALNHKNQMASKAQKAYDKVIKKYIWNDIALQYSKLYNNLI